MVRLSIALEAGLWERAKGATLEEKRATGAPGRPSMNALITKALTEYLNRHFHQKGVRHD